MAISDLSSIRCESKTKQPVPSGVGIIDTVRYSIVFERFPISTNSTYLVYQSVIQDVLCKFRPAATLTLTHERAQTTLVVRAEMYSLVCTMSRSLQFSIHPY